MECIFGVTGPDFTIIAADRTAMRSIVKFKDDENKIIKLSDHVLIAGVGEQGDRVQFTEFIAKNLALNELRMGYESSTLAAASFTREELAYSLRRHPYMVDLLVAGYDKDGPSLYFIDYLACMHKLQKAAHGYGSHFLYSIFDRYWKKNLTVPEALSIVKMCLHELHTRFIINLSSFQCKIVDSQGIHNIDINAV